MFVNSNHSNWDDVIDHVVFAYNTSKQESTGQTPFFMLYGREALLPIDVALGNNPNPAIPNDSLCYINFHTSVNKSNVSSSWSNGDRNNGTIPIVKKSLIMSETWSWFIVLYLLT
jgi:hypothetical protein